MAIRKMIPRTTRVRHLARMPLTWQQRSTNLKRIRTRSLRARTNLVLQNPMTMLQTRRRMMMMTRTTTAMMTIKKPTRRS
jgi:hypothetical protein